MVSKTDIVNRALQTIGTRTTVTDAELAGNTTNEAIQANLIYDNVRQDLLRMAPWNCGLFTANLTYIASAPGTPENTSAATTTWVPGQPSPPWAYEYQFPNDCLRACWVVPQYATGFSGGIPITTAVTGGAPSFWQGQPVRFFVGIDKFFPVTAATVVAGGTNYAVGDIITLASGATSNPPIGAPVQLAVATLAGSAVATVTVVSQVPGEATPQGGSYFAKQTNPVAQGSTTGVGTGATFNLTYGAQSDQRVILTNQEFAILKYVRDVSDVNIFDTQFQSALTHILGARLCMALTGDKGLANASIMLSNAAIMEARKSDGNEALTVNDITPDWIRIRGIYFTEGLSGPYGTNFDWGSYWPLY